MDNLPPSVPPSAEPFQPPALPSNGRGWHWLWVIPAGCLSLVLLIVAFIAILFFFVEGAIRSSDACQTGLRRAENNRAVSEALGTPISEGWFVSGNINVRNDAGDADIAIPIKGPKGTGTINVKGTKHAGAWQYSEMKASLSNGEQIDLLEQQ